MGDSLVEPEVHRSS